MVAKFENKKIEAIYSVLPAHEVDFMDEVGNYSFTEAQMKKLISYADKNGVCIELSHRSGLALERDMVKWAKAGGCTMNELTAHHLIQNAGEDLNRLNAEMKKLTAYADGGEITDEMVDLLVSKSADASVYDLFGFIVAGNTDKALKALSVLFYQRVTRRLSFAALKRGYYAVRSADMVAEDLFYSVHMVRAFPQETEFYVYPRLIDTSAFDQPLRKLIGDVAARNFILKEKSPRAGAEKIWDFVRSL